MTAVWTLLDRLLVLQLWYLSWLVSWAAPPQEGADDE